MADNIMSLDRRQVLGGASALAAAVAAPAAAARKAPSQDFAGKGVLITGCSSGFGRLTALLLARSGARVVASMRNLQGGKRPEAQELLKIAKSEKLKLSVIEIDVTDDSLVQSGVREAERIAGSLDVLVNNAGIGLGGPVEIADVEATRLIFETNLFGYLRMARAVLPVMRAARRGLILNVSSQLGRVLIPNIGLYSATKFGVEAMFETMAYELVPFGVEIAIIEPGGYPTKIWENGQRYSNDLLARVDITRKSAYAGHISASQRMFQGGGSTDPMDVPRAIAEIIAMPAGTRPLRRPVHPNTEATDAINAVSAKVQSAIMENGPYADWHKAVTS